MWDRTRLYGRLLLGVFVLAGLVFDLGSNPDKAAAAELKLHSATPVHLPYPIAYPVSLTEIGGQLLEPAAADAFQAMVRAARQEGAHIVLRSGYRSHSRQSWLFFGVAAARGISLAERARVSAPPGYSEHHTGFALDLDDGQDPQPMQQSFERTRAGKWLIANAHRFCFEMSFPRDNPQGIDYGPWHWRFVGSSEAARTFALAHARFPTVADEILRQAAGVDTGNRICTGVPAGTAQTEAASNESADCRKDPECQIRLDQVAEGPRFAESAQR